MGRSGLEAAIVVTAALLAATALYPQPIWQTETFADTVSGVLGDDVGRFGSSHHHAYLFFHVNGSRKPMGDAYIEQDRKAHFHGDDSIIHIEATGVDIGYTLDALNISLNRSCLSFHPDDESYCEDATTDLRVHINGEQVPIQEALAHDIEQGDNIVLFHGTANQTVPKDFHTRDLPQQYQANPPGQRV